jgi:hypothetical protein
MESATIPQMANLNFLMGGRIAWLARIANKNAGETPAVPG